jgi:hypothetical protein
MFHTLPYLFRMVSSRSVTNSCTPVKPVGSVWLWKYILLLLLLLLLYGVDFSGSCLWNTRTRGITFSQSRGLFEHECECLGVYVIEPHVKQAWRSAH